MLYIYLLLHCHELWSSNICSTTASSIVNVWRFFDFNGVPTSSNKCSSTASSIVNVWRFFDFNGVPTHIVINVAFCNNIYNLGQKGADKFTKLSKMGFSVDCFTADFLRLLLFIYLFYKVLHGFSPPILNDIFVPVSRPYNFRRNDTLQRRRVNSVRHGTESVSFLGPKRPVTPHFYYTTSN